MTDSASIQDMTTTEKRHCFQAGFLPVPLQSVPPESLQGIEVFIYTHPTYSLYKSCGLEFNLQDYNRLIEAGTEHVYISTRDHQKYYDAIESSLNEIVSDKKIALKQKCDVLYATTMALTKEITKSPPEGKTITKAEKLTESTIKLILNNPKAFQYLFKVSNHDFFTATHMSNVSILLVSFAEKIGIRDIRLLHDIGTGGMLHDIGKVFIPNDLLNSTEKLTTEEFDLIKGHVQRGLDHLREKADLSENVIKLVAEHHEKMDGSGYPNALQTDEISIFGRMITIVDMFEAMTSVRPYRDKSFSPEQAMDIIAEMTPKQLDEKVVNSFVQFIDSSLLGIEHPEDDNDDNNYILSALGISKADTDNPSGRRHKRYYFRIKTSVRTVSVTNKQWRLGPEKSVIAHNISQSGMGLLSPNKYEIGQIISISLYVPKLGKTINYFAKIVRYMDHTDGWYTLGAEFVKEKTYEHVNEIYMALK